MMIEDSDLSSTERPDRLKMSPKGQLEAQKIAFRIKRKNPSPSKSNERGTIEDKGNHIYSSFTSD